MAKQYSTVFEIILYDFSVANYVLCKIKSIGWEERHYSHSESDYKIRHIHIIVNTYLPCTGISVAKKLGISERYVFQHIRGVL